MKLYVCYGTWTVGKPVHAHPCGEAHKAVVEAGYEPEVIRSYGLGVLPSVVNELAPGRRKVKELTGNYWVPVLVTDDGEVIQSSPKIIEWAQAHPAGESAEATRAGAAGGAAPAGTG
jgi:Glutathione S-transferase, N-terminal domain